MWAVVWVGAGVERGSPGAHSPNVLALAKHVGEGVWEGGGCLRAQQTGDVSAGRAVVGTPAKWMGWSQRQRSMAGINPTHPDPPAPSANEAPAHTWIAGNAIFPM